MKKTIKKLKSPVIALLAIFMALGGIAFLYAPAEQNEQNYSQARGGNLIGTFNEKIDYTKTDVDTYVISPAIPGYIASSYSCGITAGGNIISWYNKQYPELIPGHTAGSTFLGAWRWTGQNAAIDNMFTNLYTAMGSNPNGTTISNYKSGLTSYTAGKGRTMNITSVYNSSNSLSSSFKTAIKNGQLLSIFLDGFNLSSLEFYTGYDKVLVSEYAGAHVMTAYGYYEVSYLNAQNVKFRTDTYLLVGTSYNMPATGLLRINTNCTIDDAYITHVN